MKSRYMLPALAGVLVASGASATSICVDAFGHTYVVRQAFGGDAGVHCSMAADDAGPVPAQAPAERVIAPLMPAAGGGGMLALAPPLAGLPSPPIKARRARFDALIHDVARVHDLDPDLLRAMVQVESGFDPGAISPRGAIGLMQLMPATATRLGLAGTSRLLLEPATNLQLGARYLRQLLRQFGALDLAVAAYNAGEGAVARYGGSVPPYPETQAYVRDVLALYAQLQAAR